MVAFHKQLNRHDPANGIYGDCFRSVIACLLDQHPSAVPHFCDGPDDGKAMDRLYDYLHPLGLNFVEIPFGGVDDVEQVLEIGAHYSRGMPYTLMGTSRTGVNHLVICRGSEIIHDPSLTNSSIIGPASDGYFYLGWLFRMIEENPA